MDDQVLWFEWTRKTPIDLPELHKAVQDGGMGLAGMRLLGEFEFGDGFAQLKGNMGPRLEYGGTRPADGKWDIEVVGYESGATPAASGIRDYRRPEVYQP